MRIRTSTTAALALLVACGAPSAGGQEPPSDKVFVCKFVRKPGEQGFELLQGGGNPISVNINSLTTDIENVAIGDQFEDAQGLSVVIAFDTGQDEPDVSECLTVIPTVPTTTTTTVAVTTTTAAPPPPPISTTTTEASTSTSAASTTTSAPRSPQQPPTTASARPTSSPSSTVAATQPSAQPAPVETLGVTR